MVLCPDIQLIFHRGPCHYRPDEAPEFPADKGNIGEWGFEVMD